MPARKDFNKFDPLFEKVTRHCIGMMLKDSSRVKDGRLFEVPCGTPGQAMNLTMQLRQYWNALAAAADAGIIPPEDPRYEISQHCKLLACKQKDKHKGGKTVEIVHRSQLTTSMAIAAALGLANSSLNEAVKIEGEVPQPVPGMDSKMKLEELKAGTKSQDELIAGYAGGIATEK
jgi:hypothetical protein